MQTNVNNFVAPTPTRNFLFLIPTILHEHFLVFFPFGKEFPDSSFSSSLMPLTTRVKSQQLIDGSIEMVHFLMVKVLGWKKKSNDLFGP